MNDAFYDQGLAIHCEIERLEAACRLEAFKVTYRGSYLGGRAIVLAESLDEARSMDRREFLGACAAGAAATALPCGESPFAVVESINFTRESGESGVWTSQDITCSDGTVIRLRSRGILIGGKQAIAMIGKPLASFIALTPNECRHA